MKIHLAHPSTVSAHLSMALTILLSGCSGAGTASIIPSGGSNTANGGTTDAAGDVGGSAGDSSAGGASTGPANTGGVISMGNGGSPNTGGSKSAGGAPATGGFRAATGGMVNTGGTRSATGGMVSTGGTKSAAGGIVNTGGTKSATGGMSPTGGAKATGGMPTGGMAPTGGAKATGGAVATSCSFPSGWNPGSPTYTTYSLPNAQTACGYNGSNNIIKNIAVGANFAAIPDGSSTFANGNRCGACVQIGSAIITIVDECPTSGGQNAPCAANLTGHLDLSIAAASAGGVKGDPSLKNQAAWKYIPCPITGNVIVRLKNGNDNEFYIENEILPIQSVTCGGQTGSRTSYGSWHFGANVNGQSCSATDIGGRSITFTVGNTQGQDVDTGKQFPKCS